MPGGDGVGRLVRDALVRMDRARVDTRSGRNTVASGERWARFAGRIKNEFGLVLLLVLAAYVIASVAPYNGSRPPLVAAAASIIAIVALATAAARPAVVRWAVWLSVAAVALAAVSVATDEGLFRGLDALILVVLLIAAASALLRAVLREREVGFRTILGAVSVYIMLGLLFTLLYYGIDQIQSDPFFRDARSADSDHLLFFSLTTLTGTGYGDLVPDGQPGMMFAGLEMLIGQMFLVTLIAGLVSLWRPHVGLRSRRHSEQSQRGSKRPSYAGDEAARKVELQEAAPTRQGRRHERDSGTATSPGWIS